MNLFIKTKEVIIVSWTNKLRMDALVGAGKAHEVSDEMEEMELEEWGYEPYY
ncbi:MAG: hypothetical protein ACP5N3_01300 [Candidatus Nanoarchaeia archaeon]